MPGQSERDEIERLREALRAIVDYRGEPTATRRYSWDMRDIARKALEAGS